MTSPLHYIIYIGRFWRSKYNVLMSKNPLKTHPKKSLNFLKKGVDMGDVLWYYNQAPEKRGQQKKDLEN